MESVYEECLCYELSQLGLHFQRQVHLPINYKGIKLDCGFKMDLLVEDAIVIELKTVDELLPVHSAQLLTYLKFSGKKVGLLINFNEPILRKGLKRMVNHYREPSTNSYLRPLCVLYFVLCSFSASLRLRVETCCACR